LQACENALLGLKRTDIANPKIDELVENAQVYEKIKRLKDFAMTSAASRSGRSSLFVKILRKKREL
jgi:hypothetical protein